MRGGDRPTHVFSEVAPSRGGLHQRVSSAKTAEPIEIPFTGLTHADSRSNVPVE